MLEILVALVILLVVAVSRAYRALRAPRVDATTITRAGRVRSQLVKRVRPGLPAPLALLLAIGLTLTPHRRDQMPTSTRAGLPAAAQGLFSQVSNSVRGVWVSTAYQFVKLGGEYADPREWGAVFDGASHPLSSRYATLAAAQADYPHAIALTDELDWAACQGAINDLHTAGDGLLLWPRGHGILNRQLTLNASTTYRGAGRATILDFGTNAISCLKLDGNGVTLDGLALLDFKIMGTRGSNAWGIDLKDGATYVISNVWAEGFGVGVPASPVGGGLRLDNIQSADITAFTANACDYGTFATRASNANAWTACTWNGCDTGCMLQSNSLVAGGMIVGTNHFFGCLWQSNGTYGMVFDGVVSCDIVGGHLENNGVAVKMQRTAGVAASGSDDIRIMNASITVNGGQTGIAPNSSRYVFQGLRFAGAGTYWDLSGGPAACAFVQNSDDPATLPSSSYILSSAGKLVGVGDNVTTKTAAYTLTRADKIVWADATGGSYTLTAPTTSSDMVGLSWLILRKDATANTVTIQRQVGTDTLNGLSSVALNGQYQAIMIEIVAVNTYHVRYLSGAGMPLVMGGARTANQALASGVARTPSTTRPTRVTVVMSGTVPAASGLRASLSVAGTAWTNDPLAVWNADAVTARYLAATVSFLVQAGESYTVTTVTGAPTYAAQEVAL